MSPSVGGSVSRAQHRIRWLRPFKMHISPRSRSPVHNPLAIGSRVMLSWIAIGVVALALGFAGAPATGSPFVAASRGAASDWVSAWAPPPTLAVGTADDDATRTPVRRPTRPATGAAPSEEHILAAFGREDYAGALELISVALKERPRDQNLHYNGACALALLGRPDEAIRWLTEAVRHGFRDLDLMVEDPDLASLRGDPRFTTIVEGRTEPRVPASRQALQQQERWRERFGEEHYHYAHDEELRVHFAIALDEEARARMREMLRRQGRQQITMLFGSPPADAVFVAVPRPVDGRTFFRELGERDATFASPGIAGIYEHRPRRIVSVDIGSSLRHEFTHALHYGHMERLRQPHPLWIQEGLATLYEEYELREDGTITFLPNERHNFIRTMVRAGRAMGWRELAEMDAKDFMDRAQRTYPHVRSMFEFIAERGKLETWYRAYTSGFAKDRSGLAAIEEVFGAPIETIEREWRQWVTRRPAVATSVRSGGASLGIEVDDTNDGARILRVRAGGAASRAGLRRNDVIVAVDDQPVASSTELVRIIAARRVGDMVRLRIRRGGEYSDGTVRLQALRLDD